MERINYVTTCLSAMLFITGCHQGSLEKDAGSEAVKVEVCEVSPVSMSQKGHYSGTIEEKNGTLLSFSTPGTIRSMNVRLGDHVREGTLIGVLDDAAARSSHAAAAAALTQAEDAYRRMKQLHDKGSLPEIKWVEVQSKLEQARSMETLARKQLNDCQLRAPYAGTIAEKTGEAGQNVIPGQSVAKLVSTGNVQVKIAVPEAEIGRIRTGQAGQIRVAALGGKTYAATVTERGVTANALSRSYEVKLNVNEAGSELLPGMVCEVALASEGENTAYVLPVHIVQLDEKNRTFVWKDNEGKAEKCYITCSDFESDGVVVTEGLQAGDRVIVKGQHKVCNGTPVSIEDKK
ncbi:MAG TPA: efflux RND transporter periplasmic adaptor subunit [Candidatus Bacteroides merdipullorum]|uniref:Efflux RND transporter periplasmic adaptor subunit n=1 Tax=Candidatus Bacteroides merdipullorum TaxID=2838474 RepID=A0A9D2CY33_9BACE|nr:efflux RND transporter periplasmic adaptor subunit [Candidatus Bacteroides merdipullorum]